MIETIFTVIIHRSTFGNEAARNQKNIRNVSKVKYNDRIR